jgi:hypothetical protein
MRSRLFPLLLLGALAGCDSDPLAPEPIPTRTSEPGTPEYGTAEPVGLAIQDVLDRIIPTLEGQPGATGLRAALETVPVDGTAVERILLRLEGNPENAPDISVIRLALTSR